MDNTNIAPVDHGVLSATGNVAAGAAGGFVKTGLKAMGGWVLGLAAIGALVGVAVVTVTVGSVAAAALWGMAIGGGIGLLSSPLAGGIGAAIGTFTGAGHAAHKVKLEKGAANVMQAQVEAYKAEAQAQAIAAANDNRYNFPAQGSQYNPAGTTVNVVQADGRLNGQQLQRA